MLQKVTIYATINGIGVGDFLRLFSEVVVTSDFMSCKSDGEQWSLAAGRSPYPCAQPPCEPPFWNIGPFESEQLVFEIPVSFLSYADYKHFFLSL
jgi:hypothetical protein